jgi:hypothetical protein
VAGDDHGFAFLDQFKEARELAFGLMHVDLHGDSLVHLLS